MVKSIDLIFISFDFLCFFFVICSRSLDKIMGQKCTCSAKSNCAEWDPLEECDVLIESIQNETDIRKIAETSHRCLKLMSMNDACEFMVKHQYPITFKNIIKFKELTMKFYNIRLEIMKQLILK